MDVPINNLIIVFYRYRNVTTKINYGMVWYGIVVGFTMVNLYLVILQVIIKRL